MIQTDIKCQHFLHGVLFFGGDTVSFLITRFGGERVDGAQGSSGYQPGRPHASKKEPLKFDDDYDFEQANEQFQEFCSKFEVTHLL